MHDLNYFLEIKNKINEYINTNTKFKLNELSFKLDKNLEIVNTVIICFIDDYFDNLSNNDLNSIEKIVNIKEYCDMEFNCDNILFDLCTKSSNSQLDSELDEDYYHNLYTKKINEKYNDVYKQYYSLSYFLEFSLNENGDFDIIIKNNDGKILSKENLETIGNSLKEGENYD